jgi:signal transduction histidine kinase
MTLERIARGWRRHPLAVDIGLAIAAGLMATLRITSLYRLNEEARAPVDASETLSIVLAWSCVLPVAIRRIWPETSFLLCMAAFIATRVWYVPEPTVTVVVLVGLYISLGIHGSPRWRTTVRVVGTVAFVVMYVALSVREARRADLGGAFNSLLAFDAAFSALLIVTGWVLGDVYRSRAEYALELEARTLQLDEQRQLNADRAVVDERMRIARELHDVLAHHVSVMGVQAGAAGRVVEHDPQRAKEALAVIEASSRESIDEFRRLVGFLRVGADIESSGPQPGLARLDELVADTRRSKIDVEVAVTGEAVILPAGIDLSAFRVVQEALTNARKHADPTRVDLTIDYQPMQLAITVINDGRASMDGGTGLGLIGMGERLRLHEGRLETGPVDGGGFRVHAVFPLRSKS